MGNWAGKRLEICVVEDEEDLREEIVESLQEAGFNVRGFPASRELYASLLMARCDIAILDIGLPGEDGFSIATRLRELGSIGIIMLTARSHMDDRLLGLQSGADVYLVKPVDFVELEAVVLSLARRVVGSDAISAPPPNHAPSGLSRLSADGWSFIDSNGRSMLLTVQESMFLKALFAHPRETVVREDLMLAIGADPYESDFHRLDALISRLRKKASDQGVFLPLRTVRGSGYQIAD